MPSGEKHAWRDRISRKCGLVGLCGIRAREDMLTRWVAARGDPELAQLLALTIALGAAIIATTAGISTALAAFAAGMIIGAGDARHAVENEIWPFRDLSVGVFFIGIGT
jgi:CPA2 family monovalent cation:H+ antiporter-2